MDFVDETLIQLADPATRDALFDSTALEQCLNAAYDLSTHPVDGPFSARYDEFRLGFAAPSRVRVEGLWADVSGGTQTRINLEVDGLSPNAPRADALWRGAIIARTQSETATITELKGRRLVGDIDAEIAAGPGGLPADPVQLEARRRTVLKAKVQAIIGLAGVIDDARFDAWLASLGAASAGEVVASLQGDRSVEGLTVSFSAAPAAVAVPKVLPIAAVLMIRGAPLSVGAMLAESKALSARLSDGGFDMPPAEGFLRRYPVIVIWITPADIFNDAGWPGATAGQPAAAARAARRDAAGRWLAAEGIGLAVR